MAFANGYTMALKYNLDHLGILYLTIAGLWTVILLIGVSLLVQNRHLPYIRIRNVPLVVSAVCTLHVYWVLCFAAYVMNGFFPCATEFWIMSIYLPLGIALYHASNTQLLYIASLQRKYTAIDGPVGEKDNNNNFRGWRRLVYQFILLNSYKKTMICITVAMLVQLVFAFFIFITARQFHPSFGAYGHDVGFGACRKGWEWLPSIAWQFFWAWIYAPYLLWKVRTIHDVNGWRVQTIVCSIASLPASPLWLNALYNHGMSRVSHYFVPPMWFTPSIFLMQAFAVFMPLYQIYRTRKLRTETLQIIEDWQDKQNSGTSIMSGTTRVDGGQSKTSMKSSAKSSTNSRRNEMFTMPALEKALHTNPAPLQSFASNKDFSGENIAFLTNVQDWKNNWQASSRSNTRRLSRLIKDDPATVLRKQFSLAVSIYSSFVDPRYAAFPINLSSTDLKSLELLFAEASASLNHRPSSSTTNTIAPFEDLEVASTSTVIGSGADLVSLNMSDLAADLPADVTIPAAFGPEVFDNAEASIKYMVLTNTWAKFVREAGQEEEAKEKKHLWDGAREVVGAWARRCSAALGVGRRQYRHFE